MGINQLCHFDPRFDILGATSDSAPFLRIHSKGHSCLQAICLAEIDIDGVGRGIDPTNIAVGFFKTDHFQSVNFPLHEVDPIFEIDNIFL